MKKLTLPDNYVEITNDECAIVEGGGFLDEILAPALNSMYNTLISVSVTPYAAAGLSIGRLWTNFGLTVANNFMSNLTR